MSEIPTVLGWICFALAAIEVSGKSAALFRDEYPRQVEHSVGHDVFALVVNATVLATLWMWLHP